MMGCQYRCACLKVLILGHAAESEATTVVPSAALLMTAQSGPATFNAVHTGWSALSRL